MLVVSCSGINFSISRIYFRWYDSNNQVMTRIQLHQPSYHLFQADDRVWVLTWFNAKAFLTPIWPKYRKIIQSCIIAKVSIFLFKKTDFDFFL